MKFVIKSNSNLGLNSVICFAIDKALHVEFFSIPIGKASQKINLPKEAKFNRLCVIGKPTAIIQVVERVKVFLSKK